MHASGRKNLTTQGFKSMKVVIPYQALARSSDPQNIEILCFKVQLEVKPDCHQLGDWILLQKLLEKKLTRFPYTSSHKFEIMSSEVFLVNMWVIERRTNVNGGKQYIPL